MLATCGQKSSILAGVDLADPAIELAEGTGTEIIRTGVSQRPPGIVAEESETAGKESSFTCDPVETTGNSTGAGGGVYTINGSSCIEYYSEGKKTYAATWYSRIPPTELSLHHIATVQTLLNGSEVGYDSEPKFASSGLACPVVWVFGAGAIDVNGSHDYQTDNDSVLFQLQSTVSG